MRKPISRTTGLRWQEGVSKGVLRRAKSVDWRKNGAQSWYGVGGGVHDDVAGERVILELDTIEDVGLAMEREEGIAVLNHVVGELVEDGVGG